MTNEEKILNLLQQMQINIQQMQTDITGIKTGQERIEKKLDDVYNQTADLTEFRTEANTKLDKISDDIDFLKHEEYQTKQDIFKLKKNLEIIK